MTRVGNQETVSGMFFGGYGRLEFLLDFVLGFLLDFLREPLRFEVNFWNVYSCQFLRLFHRQS